MYSERDIDIYQYVYMYIYKMKDIYIINNKVNESQIQLACSLGMTNGKTHIKPVTWHTTWDLKTG